MARSVSYPTGAVVAFRTITIDYYDDWDDFLDWLTDTACDAFPSLEPSDGWRGREDRVLARNRLAEFGVSEYCGLVAVWIVARDDTDLPDLADRWLRQIAPKFTGLFAELRLLAYLSNGEAVFERIVA